ncbi:MAG: hypothetical protein Q4A74_08210 [Cardiobacteriaceae bacterium]|nr:hypothetical protein [Cardiobacteriaceae bacterium]
MGKPLRRLFHIPSEWEFVGRDAVLQKTAVLYAAEHRMGSLPDSILAGEMLPEMVNTP